MIKDLFSFDGCSTRQQWWITGIIISAIMVIGPLLDGLLMDMIGLPIFTFILWPLCVIMGIANNTRRLHDRGKSGWFQLIVLIPAIGNIWLVVECGFLPAED